MTDKQEKSPAAKLRERLVSDKAMTQSEWIAELRKIDPIDWNNKLLSTRFFEKVYRISPSTMRNYRSGYYFANNGDKYWLTELHETLHHLQPGGGHPKADLPGGAVKTTIPWMNEWLRKIGKEDKIPRFLKHM
jgi:hypothetical protein